MVVLSQELILLLSPEHYDGVPLTDTKQEN